MTLKWSIDQATSRLTFGKLIPMAGNTYDIAVSGQTAGAQYTFFVMDQSGEKCLARSERDGTGKYTIAFNTTELRRNFDKDWHEIRSFHTVVSDGTNTIAEGDLQIQWNPVWTDPGTGEAYSMRGPQGPQGPQGEHGISLFSEYPSTYDFPAVGETGRLYVAQNRNEIYRWNGTSYSKFFISGISAGYGWAIYPTENGGDGKWHKVIIANGALAYDSEGVDVPPGEEYAKQADLDAEVRRAVAAEALKADISYVDRLMSDSASNYWKREVFKTPWYFNRGETGLTYDTAASAMAERYDGISGRTNPIIAQGCSKFSISGEEYLAVKYTANGGTLKDGESDMAVVSFFDFDTGSFAGYVLVECASGQGIVVRNEDGVAYLYAVDYDGNLAKYELPESYDGQTLSGTKTSLTITIRDLFYYSDGMWAILTSSEGSNDTTNSRAVIILDDDFRQKALWHLPTYRFGYSSNSEMKSDPTDQRNFFPHTQGLAISQDGIVLFQGGASNNQNSELGNANCGAIIIGSDGGIRRSSLCRITPFMDKLGVMVRSDINSSENEGGFVENGKVYALYITNSDGSGEGFMIRVVEEFSASPDAVDFSSSAWIEPQVELGGLKEIPSQSKVLVDGKYVYSYTNPITGEAFETFDDILKFILLTGLTEFVINTTNTGIVKLGGNNLTSDDRSLVRITRWTTKMATNTTARLFLLNVIRYGETNVSHPENVSRNVIARIDNNGTVDEVFEIPCSFGQLYVGGCVSQGSTGSASGNLIILSDVENRIGGGMRYVDKGSASTNNMASLSIDSAGLSHVDLGNNSVSNTRIYSNGKRLDFDGASLAPSHDNAIALGSASKRYSDVFAENSTIQTSDERAKTGIKDIPDEVLDAWEDVEFRKFLFRSSVDSKGSLARLHVGVIAQQVRDAFSAKGLDASKYGFFCHDSWGASCEVSHRDENGNVVIDTPARESGDAFSIRYAEALVIEAAYQRRRADRLESRIALIEERISKLS